MQKQLDKSRYHAEVKKLDVQMDWCDKYEFGLAAFCGAMAGFVDVFFVQSPAARTSLLGLSDAAADEMVKKFARFTGWKPRAGNENNVASAIGYLERTFRVNYDQKNSVEVGGAVKLSTKNHHIKSLAHSPDVVGLFFSILDQFQGKSSFLDNGKLIRIDTSGGDFELKGGNFLAKLFSGFANWLGHIMSDAAGSTGSRGNGGRGTGVPMPFMELTQFCKFGRFQIGKDRQTFAELMARTFQNGYDARFGAATMVPVLFQQLATSACWAIKRHLVDKKPWADCIPSDNYGSYRMMQLVSNGTLCLIDVGDAALRSGGNALTFCLHFNFAAALRLAYLVLKEINIRFGAVLEEKLKAFYNEIVKNSTPEEREYLRQMDLRVQNHQTRLDEVYRSYCASVEEEYRRFAGQVKTMDSVWTRQTAKAAVSVQLAESSGVKKEKIIHSTKELDEQFGKRERKGFFGIFRK